MCGLTAGHVATQLYANPGPAGITNGGQLGAGGVIIHVHGICRRCGYLEQISLTIPAEIYLNQVAARCEAPFIDGMAYGMKLMAARRFIQVGAPQL